jgi:hypothetical protein
MFLGNTNLKLFHFCDVLDQSMYISENLSEKQPSGCSDNFLGEDIHLLQGIWACDMWSTVRSVEP